MLSLCIGEFFRGSLKNGLGRIAFVQKKYADAERWYGDVVAHCGDSHFTPEGMYWRAVAHYNATNDHTVLGKVAEELRSKYARATSHGDSNQLNYASKPEPATAENDRIILRKSCNEK